MKIIQAINAMINNASKIANVTPDSSGPNMYYFCYLKYVWSIAFNNDVYYLCFYPGPQNDVKKLANMDPNASLESVCYNTKELKTPEARESFAQLYKLTQERQYGVAEILDEIIADDVPF